jgi:hypothetical protein
MSPPFLPPPQCERVGPTLFSGCAQVTLATKRHRRQGKATHEPSGGAWSWLHL